MNGWKQLLFPLYITFLKNKYLFLEETNKNSPSVKLIYKIKMIPMLVSFLLSLCIDIFRTLITLYLIITLKSTLALISLLFISVSLYYLP